MVSGRKAPTATARIAVREPILDVPTTDRGEALVMAPELGVLGGQGGRGRTRLRALLRRRLELLPE